MIKNVKRKWSKDELLDFQDRWRAVTIPVNVKINNKQTALHLDYVFDIINSSEKIAVKDCFCRIELQNCDFPLKVCLSLNEAAEKYVANGEAEFISKTEAEKIIQDIHQKGLVHLALHRLGEDEKHIQVVCSCCSCCCHALQELLLMNMKGLIEPSIYISTHDSTKCINCGKCTYQCQFNARSLSEEDIMTYNPNHCFGCGLCVTICPQKAIQMVKRKL